VALADGDGVRAASVPGLHGRVHDSAFGGVSPALRPWNPSGTVTYKLFASRYRNHDKFLPVVQIRMSCNNLRYFYWQRLDTFIVSTPTTQYFSTNA
jgi:hypothetical protein